MPDELSIAERFPLVIPDYKNVQPSEEDLKWFKKFGKLKPSGDPLVDAAKYDKLANDGGMVGSYFDAYTGLLTLVMFFEDAEKQQSTHSKDDYPLIWEQASVEKATLSRLLDSYDVNSRTVDEYNLAEALRFIEV